MLSCKFGMNFPCQVQNFCVHQQKVLKRNLQAKWVGWAGSPVFFSCFMQYSSIMVLSRFPCRDCPCQTMYFKVKNSAEMLWKSLDFLDWLFQEVCRFTGISVSKSLSQVLHNQRAKKLSFHIKKKK